MKTIPFDRDPRQRDPLLAKAAELPQDVAPRRDLWPDIRAKLDAEPGSRQAWPRWPAALAAGFAIAAVSALLTWGVIQRPGPAAQAEAGFTPVSYRSETVIGPVQLQARNELLGQFRQRLAELSPETRAVVLANLEVIQRAADEIDAALAQDPNNGLLNELLANAFQQEMGLYSRLVTADGAGAWRS